MLKEQHKFFLITGGAGFIGSNFVKQMVEMGHRIIVLDALTYAGHKENLDLFNAEVTAINGR